MIDPSSPFTFPCGARAKNRVVLAPMTNPQSHGDGSLGDDELRWLERRARGGFGVVVTCAAHVTKDGQGFDRELGLFGDELLPGLRRLASTLREQGALAVAQIFHAGARAHASVSRRIGASDHDGAHAMTEDEIAALIDRFAAAAARAHRAGFDGVELHAAHAYLLCQFLSRTSNRRDDRWGGSLENRARLLLETMKAVRARVPASFLVGVRLSPQDFAGLSLDIDESIEVAREVARLGADWVDLSLWNAHEPSKKHPDRHPLAMFRAALDPSTPIVVAGSLWTRADVDEMFSLGADLVAVGRAAILNPDWPTHLADPAWEPRRPPMSRAELHDLAVTDPFVDYLRRWKGFVAEE